MIINGNNSAVIVISRNATEREKYAAQELRSYIEKIVGVNLSVVDDAHIYAKQQFIIGGPARNAAAQALISMDEFDAQVTGDEGFMLRSFGADKILIAGREGCAERGTVYAVYELLERYLGCSLSAYSHPDIAAGECVPRMAEICLSDIDYVKAKADCAMRGAVVQFADAAGDVEKGLNLPFFKWLIKNRYNYVYFWTKSFEELKKLGLVDEITKMGIELLVGHHDALDMFMPFDGNEYFPEKYYETHPEYFRLEEDGTRYKPVNHWGQMILCNRSEEMIDTISENIIKWCNMNPGVKLVNPAPHDGRAPQCCCEKCKPYTKMENYTYFSNEIAKRVQKVRPDVKIVMIAYVDLWEPPANFEPCENLLIMEATWHNGILRDAGTSDGTGLIGTEFEENVLRWRDAGVGAFFYDYYMGVYQARQRWLPMADELQAIGKSFVEKGVMGSVTQIECFNHWNNIFNFYCFGRTLYDVALSMEDNLARFGRIFGKASEYICKIIRMAEAALEGQATIMLGGLYMVEHIDKETVYSCFEKALDVAETPTQRNNVRLLRMAFRYTDLEPQQENGRIIQEAADYQTVRTFGNINQELLHMTQYDSFWNNYTGYGIGIPVIGEKVDGGFAPEADRWYCFE